MSPFTSSRATVGVLELAAKGAADRDAKRSEGAESVVASAKFAPEDRSSKRRQTILALLKLQMTAIRRHPRETSPIQKRVVRRVHEGRGRYVPTGGKTMHGAHRKAAEHELAAHGHRSAAKHDEKGDNVAGNWHSERALERQFMLLLLVVANLAALPVLAKAQSLPDSGDSSGAVARTTPAQPGLPYARPAETTKLRNYFFDAFGPNPIVGAALTAGINQVGHSPPEWKQGAEGYGKRFGSDFGIAAVTTTTRYALAEAFQEDTLYYRCECIGLFPRLRHAVISTLTARRGGDGHHVFSFPALVGPYAGAMAAVYGWYPSRYGTEDALRMGTFALLAYMGENISLEFLYSGPHSLLSRAHLSNRHGAPNPGSNP
jgi:hypothetical protein